VSPYERDILDEYAEHRAPRVYPSVEAALGLVIEDRSSGFCGDIVKVTSAAVTLRGRSGQHRHFRWTPGGFLLEGKPVTLVPVTRAAPAVTLTASGSVAATAAKARTARASRIWVEGKHDAELVEHVWGDDLRELGIVVEPLGGIDDLVGAVREFGPSPTRRLGVLVDHLVDGSKEARIVAPLLEEWGHDEHVLVTGHPFVDIWAGIQPRTMGRDAWPDVPRGQDWKTGFAAALGTTVEGFWPSLRNRVTTYADLRPELVGAVERLIDFVEQGT
jgi:hypothetical protein